MLSKGQAIFQGTYIFLWIIMSIGISGNIELGYETHTAIWVIYGILSFLMMGKMIYWYKDGRFEGEWKW